MQLGTDAPKGCVLEGELWQSESGGLDGERAGGMLRREPILGPGSDP